MNELGRRGAARKNVLIPAVVTGRDGSTTVHCMITNASTSGCRIKSRRLNDIPNEISISIRRLDKPIKGQVVWRKNQQAGIRFLWETARESNEFNDAELRDGTAEKDRRGKRRDADAASATVSDRKDVRAIRCVVKNANEAGCMIVSNRIDDIPDTISIKLQDSEKPKKGKIVWRRGNTAGVSFNWESRSNEPLEDEASDLYFI